MIVSLFSALQSHRDERACRYHSSICASRERAGVRATAAAAAASAQGGGAVQREALLLPGEEDGENSNSLYPSISSVSSAAITHHTGSTGRTGNNELLCISRIFHMLYISTKATLYVLCDLCSKLYACKNNI